MEKSVLKYSSLFGNENNISVACCGSNFSAYQFQLLKDLGVEEIVFAFDRQFQEIKDAEHQKLVKKFYQLLNRFINDVNVSFIFDGQKITDYKASPIDEGAEKFVKLFRERRIFNKGVYK